jgi:hypothetical protein
LTARKPGWAFPRRDQPFLDVETLDAVGTAGDFRDAHRPLADPVRKPARVGHLVEGIDVGRANFLVAARIAELVGDKVVPFA